MAARLPISSEATDKITSIWVQSACWLFIAVTKIRKAKTAAAIFGAVPIIEATEVGAPS